MATRNKLNAALLVFLIMMVGSSCLKTRSQLKDDDDREPRAQQAQVTDVQPQGQYVIDELKSEITKLTGRLEDVERAQKQGASQSSSAAKEEIKKLENRITELEQAQANLIETVKKLETSSPAVADPVELLEKGKNQYKEQDYEEAVKSFSGYLKAPKAKKAEEATFLRGESYFKLKEYKKAVVDFSKITEKYPKSERAPAAYYRIGQCFDGLGMKEDARGFYQELVDKYPKSAEAKKVRKKR